MSVWFLWLEETMLFMSVWFLWLEETMLFMSVWFLWLEETMLFKEKLLRIIISFLFFFLMRRIIINLVSYLFNKKRSSTAWENGVEVLEGKDDKHGGVIVEMKEEEAMDSQLFVSLLRASLPQWKRQGKKGVWIKLPIGLVNLVEPAVKEGFSYHHAEPNYLMLVYWNSETISTIPANASHRVGVGAIVLNDKKEVLVVQEKIGYLRGFWKIPTGTADAGEDICKAVEREVKEETGISTEFLEIVAFSQLHKDFFEKSSLFFLCMMRPLSFDIQIQEVEIESAKWMPFEEYAAQPFTKEHECYKYIHDICLAKEHSDYVGFSPPSIKSSNLYLNNQDLNTTKKMTPSEGVAKP